jgi:hypothetical protein
MAMQSEQQITVEQLDRPRVGSGEAISMVNGKGVLTGASAVQAKETDRMVTVKASQAV